MTACGQISVSVSGRLLLSEDRFFAIEGRLFAVEGRFLRGRSPVASAWLSSAASSASFAGLLSYFFSFFFCSLRSREFRSGRTTKRDWVRMRFFSAFYTFRRPPTDQSQRSLRALLEIDQSETRSVFSLTNQRFPVYKFQGSARLRVSAGLRISAGFCGLSRVSAGFHRISRVSAGFRELNPTRRISRVSAGFRGFLRDFVGFRGNSQVSAGFLGFLRVSVGFLRDSAGFLWDFAGFLRASAGFCGNSRFSAGFHGFLLVFAGFRGFLRVFCGFPAGFRGYSRVFCGISRVFWYNSVAWVIMDWNRRARSICKSSLFDAQDTWQLGLPPRDGPRVE